MSGVSSNQSTFERLPMNSVSFDFNSLTPRERYKILIGTVVPRPIALVSTVDRNGRANAAPFSFFNCLSSDPAIVALGVEYSPSGHSKDTVRNIRDTGCFTVNVVSGSIMDEMNICAVPFDANVDEIAEAGLTIAPGKAIAAGRIAEAPAALECRLHSFLNIGESREIVLGEVVYAHFHENAIDADKLYVDATVLDAVGRMGGHGYATTRDYFELKTMSVADYKAKTETTIEAKAS